MNNVFVIIEIKDADYDDSGFTHVVGVRITDEESVKKEVDFLNSNISHDNFFNPQERCSYDYQSVTTKGYQNLHFPLKEQKSYFEKRSPRTALHLKGSHFP